MQCSSMTSKGQVTIPAEIRNSFNLKTGDKVNFISHGEYIVIIPSNKPLKDLKGILPKPKKSLSLEDINKVIQNRFKDKYHD